MTTEPEKKIRQMPKGGRKGGTVFPRIGLSDAIAYARKLVSKTHTGPQPIDVILSGVIGVKGGMGSVRVSALKQYGFLKGDTKEHFAADELAKKIVAAPPEELLPLYRQAMLKPTVFKKLFDTFHGDTVSKARLKQRAADLKVHPDETATCVDLYVAGMVTAGIVIVDGEQVKHLASGDIDITSGVRTGGDEEIADEDSATKETGEAENKDVEENITAVKNGTPGAESPAKTRVNNAIDQIGPRAVFNVNVTLDSSLDIEKLQKQLELLKRFGAI